MKENESINYLRKSVSGSSQPLVLNSMDEERIISLETFQSMLTNMIHYNGVEKFYSKNGDEIYYVNSENIHAVTPDGTVFFRDGMPLSGINIDERAAIYYQYAFKPIEHKSSNFGFGI